MMMFQASKPEFEYLSLLAFTEPLNKLLFVLLDTTAKM